MRSDLLFLVGWLYVAAATAAVLAAAIMWSHRRTAGARHLALMLAASALWAFCDALELRLPTVEGRRFVSQIQYLGVVSASPFFLHAALGLAGRTMRLPLTWIAAIWSVPVVTLAVAWTSHAHRLLWTAIHVPDGGYGPGIYEYGWWFWVLTADHYLLSTLGLLVLVEASRRVRQPFRAPLVLVAAAIALPWIGNIVYVFKLGPWPGVNWLALSLIVSGLLLAWLALREGLFDTLPAAREAIVELIADAVVVVDLAGRRLMANPAARRLLALPPGRGVVPGALLEALAISPPGDRSAAPVEIALDVAGEPRWLEAQRGDVLDRWGAPVAHLIVARDIARRKRIDAEREALIADLSAALGRIQTLEGLLPICAHCKKIRDDAGHWKHVEAYFESRTGVEFTHGICPDCSRAFFDDPTGP
jgi:PAS domain-containing protein